MTEEELRATRELADKATPGPWIAYCLGSEGYTIKGDVQGKYQNVYDTLGFSGCIGEVRAGRDWAQLIANAEFIAWARTGVPKLLNEIERLRAAFGRIFEESTYLSVEVDAEDERQLALIDKIFTIQRIARKTLEGKEEI